MEYNLENLDYKSKLLLGDRIPFEDFYVYPLQLWEIVDYSISKYNLFLSLISYNKTEIKESLGVYRDIPIYEFIIVNFVADSTNEFKDIFLHILAMITKEEVAFDSEGYFIVGTSILNHENFEKFVNIVKDQNMVKERVEKVTTKKERDYMELVKKARERHSGYLKATGKSSDTDMLDIISAVSCKHPSLNLLNIKNLTIYQLIDQLRRLSVVDNYFIAIDSLLAGAKKQDVDLSHWSKKMIEE